VSADTHFIDDLLNLECVPHQDGIRDQAQATRLIHDFLVVAFSELALIGKKQPPAKTLPVFAAVLSRAE
jgi:hypothetical protein